MRYQVIKNGDISNPPAVIMKGITLYRNDLLNTKPETSNTHSSIKYSIIVITYDNIKRQLLWTISEHFELCPNLKRGR